jgi:uncharacterized membrane protein HdeD (DUF308 family)
VVLTEMIERLGQDNAGWRHHPAAKGRPVMTPHMKIGIAGVVIGLILLIINPWLALTVIALAVAIPAIAYAMLDSNQRARLRRVRGRRQIGQ